MQKFSIEVNAPTEITLTDNEHFEQCIILEIVPTERGRGFVVHVTKMTDYVSICNDSEFENDFVFDKDEFEARMEKLRSK
jgi:hypothetical protein